MSKELTNIEEQFEKIFANVNISYNDFLQSELYKKYSKYFENEELSNVLNDRRTNSGEEPDDKKLLDAAVEILNSPEFNNVTLSKFKIDYGED